MSEHNPARLRRFGITSGLRAFYGELLTYAVVFVVLLYVLHAVDAFDTLYAWSRAHEDWELDEIILAVLSVGTTGFVFVARRWHSEYRDKRAIRKLSEELEQALAAARAADETKSAFLANLSHELRTPLNAINGYAELMEAGFAGPINARYAGYAKNIRESGEHLLSLINDILEVTRAASDSIRLRREPIDLRSLGQRCFRLLGVRAAEQNISLRNLVAADLPPVCADSQRLQQVLTNLIGNAIKFSPAGAEIQLNASFVGDTVVIEVRDFGIGMDPAAVDRATEPFVQLDSGFARNHEGVGLGLALVKRFVELHGGTLDFNTAPGKGTAVFVTLPQPAATAAEQQDTTECL